MFLQNYCAISQALVTKTCKQVYEFAQKDSIDIEKAENMKEYTPPKKKKKKKHSQWLNARKNQQNEAGTSGTATVYNYIPCDHPERYLLFNDFDFTKFQFLLILIYFLGLVTQIVTAYKWRIIVKNFVSAVQTAKIVFQEIFRTFLFVYF